MWYLRDRRFDVREAEAKLRSMLQWRRAFKWVNHDGIASIHTCSGVRGFVTSCIIMLHARHLLILGLPQGPKALKLTPKP